MQIEIPDDQPSSGGSVVPFGKYRGKPIQAMLQDSAYCEWFMSQPEMRQKYGNVYQIVVNNFGEPSETPDSNQMQAQFLNTHFCVKFATAINPSFFEFAGNEGLQLAVDVATQDIYQEKKKLGLDKAMPTYNDQQWQASGGIWSLEKGYDKKNYASAKRFISTIMPVPGKCSTPEFETEGTDVQFNISSRGFSYSRTNHRGTADVDSNQNPINYKWEPAYDRLDRNFVNHLTFRIEIKPEVGDDYPAILRQMRRSKSNVLYTRSYQGIGVDRDTFVEYFSTQGIRVIFEHNVLSQVIPEPFVFDGQQVQQLVSERIKALENTQKVTRD